MRNKKIIALLLFVVMALSMLAGCGSSSSGTSGSSGTSDKSANDNPIKIGTIDPVTGGASAYGQERLNSFNLAVERINAAGGLMGRKVILISEDSASQAAQAATLATKLITQDGVSVIAGCQTSSETMAIVDILDEYGVAACFPATSPFITMQGSMYVNRCSPDDALQVEALIKYAAQEMGATKIGFLYSNDDYGKGGYEGAVRCAEKYGIVLNDATFLNDDTNFSSQVTKLKDAGCEAVVMWCQPTAAALIIKQADEMGWTPQWLGCPGIQAPQLFELSNNLCDGMILSGSFNIDSKDPYVVDFVESYTEKYGLAPSLAAALAWDAIHVIFAGIEKAGSDDPQAIADAIRTLDAVQTLKGSAAINPETGDMTCNVYLLKADASIGSYIFYGEVSFDD